MDFFFGERKIAIIPHGFQTKCRNLEKETVFSTSRPLGAYEKEELYIQCQLDELKQLGMYVNVSNGVMR